MVIINHRNKSHFSIPPINTNFQILLILIKGIEVIKNPLPGVKNDPGARPDMVKVGEMMDDQEKTNGGKVSTPLLLEDAGIITHKVDL